MSDILWEISKAHSSTNYSYYNCAWVSSASSLPTICSWCCRLHRTLNHPAIDHGRNFCSSDQPNSGWSDPFFCDLLDASDHFDPVFVTLNREHEDKVIDRRVGDTKNAFLHAIEEKWHYPSSSLDEFEPSGIKWFNAWDNINQTMAHTLDYRYSDLRVRVQFT